MSNLQQNLRQLQDYAKEIAKAKRASVDVGVLDASGAYPGSATVVEVAATHEFGLGNVPARSFLRVPFNKNQKQLETFTQKQYANVFDGRSSTRVAIGKVGAFATNISKKAFTTNGFGTWKPLTEETVLAKGSSKPLIDTGILRRSITWKVNGV